MLGRVFSSKTQNYLNHWAINVKSDKNGLWRIFLTLHIELALTIIIQENSPRKHEAEKNTEMVNASGAGRPGH